MTEQQIFDLMMDALDDEIDEQGLAQLNAYLLTDAQLAQEWEAMQIVDTLLRETPPIVAPVNLVERTLARLPNASYRRSVLTIFYLLLLVGGMIPLIFTVWLAMQFGGDTIFGALTQALSEISIFVQLFSRAIFTTAGTIITEQPVLLGWLCLLLGIIGLWYNVYQNMVSATQPMPLAIGQSRS